MVYYGVEVVAEAIIIIQTIGAERLTLTGLVMGCALATCALLCFRARVWRS